MSGAILIGLAVYYVTLMWVLTWVMALAGDENVDD